MAKKKTTSRSRNSIPNTKGKQLVIVESPAKARTINKYLGPDYVVAASVGHVRDLPAKNPKGVKDPVPGVDLEHDFAPTYQVIKGKGTHVTELKRAAKNAESIWLATDLDREGEAIAWHLAEALKIKPETVNRVVFNAITRREIQKAFDHPRPLDMGKVNAQQARRILDRIVGYQVSPLLWKKVAGGLSAGRVQSVAVRLVVEREREIEAFTPEEFWKIAGYFTTRLDQADALGQQFRDWLSQQAQAAAQKPGRNTGATIAQRNQWLGEHHSFPAELVEVDGRKFKIDNRNDALAIAEYAGVVIEQRNETQDDKAKGPAQNLITVQTHVGQQKNWQIQSINTKRTRSRPGAPFITSTLQQTAANQLNFSAQQTMRTAQALYEGVNISGMGSVGLITYMRTDSTHLSGEAINMARQYIGQTFGDRYLPEKARFYSSSNKAAQEAHEAIRPTDASITPERAKSSLTDQQYKLYRLIWNRFVACQMEDAQWDATTVMIRGGDDQHQLLFKAGGRILAFDGFYKVTGIPNTGDEPNLPRLNEQQDLAAIQIDPTQHFTSPPPRYSEASLVKKLEAEGIGRPSTYATIIQVIQNRKYVEKIANRFHPTDLGRVVTDKLIEAFERIMDIGYTRDMEQELDNIELEHHDWVAMLRKFYGPFQQSLEAAYEQMQHAKAETEPAPHTCPDCGGNTMYRFGRNGRFLSCANYPDCKYAAPIDRQGNPVQPEQTDIACPKCKTPLLRRKGRFGPFLSCPRYPDCDGIVNLDKKGHITPSKVPPLTTDLPCPKCESPLNLRRGARGPWLSCSAFPKCRGRLGWAGLEESDKNKWLDALDAHEQANPQPTIYKTDGTPVPENYTPQVDSTEDTPATSDDNNDQDAPF